MKIATPGSSAHRREIAVVEETADNIYSLKFILQSLGYQVSSFSYQVDFLSEFRKHPPDLIIVDMLIPNEGGFGVLEKIRKSKFGEVPVLAITAEAVRSSVHHGCTGRRFPSSVSRISMKVTSGKENTVAKKMIWNGE